MYDVRIINNEAILFEDDIEVMNLEHLRDKYNRIRYEFDDGNYVHIWPNNTIAWFDSDGVYHRDDDMPTHITTNGFMQYCKHGKTHRENGPSIIHSSGKEKYWLEGNIYTKKDYIYKLNSRYGIISCMMFE